MLRRYLVTLLCLSSLLVAACGGQTEAPSPDQPPAVEGDLSLYTSQPDADAQKLVAGFTAKYPTVGVVTFRSGTEKVISKLLTESEAGEVQADVLLVADAPTFEILKAKNLLESYRSPEAAGFGAAFVDKDGTYTGTKVMSTGIIYNTKAAKPASWLDLTKAENKDKLIMPSPLYSGAAAFNLGVFTRNQSIGWKFYENLKGLNVTITQGNGDVVKRVAGGEKSYGIVVDYLALNAKKSGSPVEFIFPQEGVPVITEPVGIVKGSKNLAAAKAFVDFVLSEEGQKLAASMGYMPVRPGVEPPQGFPKLQEIKVLAANAAELNEKRDADKQQFANLFGQ